MKAETESIPDLFAIVQVTDEHSLLERLKQLGADVYCDGSFPTLADRLRHVIEHEGWARIVSGRDPQGKTENIGQAFERVTGQSIILKKTSCKTATTSNNQHNTQEV